MNGFPWIEIATLLLTGAGALGGVWYRLNNQITINREFAATELTKRSQETSVQIAAIHLLVGEFKLEVARNYATNAAIKEVEDRIVQAIDRLGDRLDKFVDQRNRA